MNEKRFKLLSGGFDEKGNPLYLIKDTTDMIGDYEICKKVIEQQATIQSLQKDIMEMSDSHQSYIGMESETHSKMNDIIRTQKGKIFRLEKENEALKEINEKLQWELNKTREDLNYFANLKVAAMRGSDCGHDRCYITSMQKKGDDE